MINLDDITSHLPVILSENEVTPVKLILYQLFDFYDIICDVYLHYKLVFYIIYIDDCSSFNCHF